MDVAAMHPATLGETDCFAGLGSPLSPWQPPASPAPTAAAAPTRPPAPGPAAAVGCNSVRELSATEGLIRVPSGYELAQVGPGLFELRPARPPAAPAAAHAPTTADPAAAAPAAAPTLAEARAAVAAALPVPASGADEGAAASAAAARGGNVGAAAWGMELQPHCFQQQPQQQQQQQQPSHQWLLPHQQPEAQSPFSQEAASGAPPAAASAHSWGAAARGANAGGRGGGAGGLGGALGARSSDRLAHQAGAGAVGALSAALKQEPDAPAAANPAASRSRKAPSQRFRERQKGLIHDLEQEVEGRMAQLQLLQQENAVLRARRGLLERAVEGQEDQIAVMRTFGVKWPFKPRGANARIPISDPAAAPPSRTSSVSSTCSGAAAAAAEGRSGAPAAAEGRGGAPAAAAGPGASHAPAAPGAPPLWEQGDGGPPSSKTHTWDADALPPAAWPPEIGMSVEEVKALRPEDVAVTWRGFVQAASRELLSMQQEAAGGGGGGGGEAAAGAAGGAAGALARLEALVGHHGKILKHVILLNPGATYPLIGLNLETGAPQATNDAFWRGVVEQLALAPEQVEDVSAIYELYTYHASRVLAERARLQACLAGAPPPRPLSGGGVEAATMLQTADALGGSFRKGHALRLMLHAFVFGRVFTPLQLARAAVFCFPVWPDVNTIARVIAERADALAPSNPAPRPPLFGHLAVRQREEEARAALGRAMRLAGACGATPGGGGGSELARLAAA